MPCGSFFFPISPTKMQPSGLIKSTATTMERTETTCLAFSSSTWLRAGKRSARRATKSVLDGHFGQGPGDCGRSGLQNGIASSSWTIDTHHGLDSRRGTNSCVLWAAPRRLQFSESLEYAHYFELWVSCHYPCSSIRIPLQHPHWNHHWQHSQSNQPTFGPANKVSFQRVTFFL